MNECVCLFTHELVQTSLFKSRPVVSSDKLTYQVCLYVLTPLATKEFVTCSSRHPCVTGAIRGTAESPRDGRISIKYKGHA